LIRCIALAALLVSAGCGHSNPAPVYNPRECAQQALAEYDADKDGRLTAKELERCPALGGVLKDVDKSKDGAIDEDELEERLKVLLDANAGLINVGCQVLRSGTAVKDAKVTFIPEKFLGPKFQPAKGVSTERGDVQLRQDDKPFPGVPCGYYRVEVSLPDASGQETLSKRWHAESKLGLEVSPFMRGIMRIDLGS
jgi:hypothetical protein